MSQNVFSHQTNNICTVIIIIVDWHLNTVDIFVILIQPNNIVSRMSTKESLTHWDISASAVPVPMQYITLKREIKNVKGSPLVVRYSENPGKTGIFFQDQSIYKSMIPHKFSPLVKAKPPNETKIPKFTAPLKVISK